MTKFFINFISQGEGRKEIQEPDGFDAAKFTLEQDDKRYGRDVSFAGGESNFSIFQRNEQHFELLKVYFERFGFEAEAEIIFKVNDLELVYDIDFANMETDLLTYMSFKAIQKSKQIILKRREDVNINLLSNKTLDNANIVPCQIHKILIKSKAISKTSKYKQPGEKTEIQGNFGGFTTRNFNYANQVLVDGVDNTLSFIQGRGDIKDFGYIEAADNLSNVKLTIRNLNVVSFENRSNRFGTGSWNLYYTIAFPDADIPSSQWVRVDGLVFNNSNPGQKEINNRTYEFSGLFLERGQRLYLWFRQTVDTQNQPYFLTTVIKNMEVEINAIQNSFNTVNPAIRLNDALKYVVKSASEMETICPDYETSGIFYNQFIFNGNFLRGIQDKPFNTTFDFLAKSIKETNSDFQILSDDKVFFGRYEEFYKNIELAVIDDTQFESFNRKNNETSKLNIFSYKYKNYQSQKENEVENTADVVHGEIQTLLANKKVENKKEIEIDWIRDSFQIEENRKKAYVVAETTATQDDDKIFAIDVFPSELITREFFTFAETAYLRHSFDSNLQELTLTNNGSFSFLKLGIIVSNTIYFVITDGQPNSGIYYVSQIYDNYIVLKRLFIAGTPPSSQNNGERFTKFVYNVPVNTLTGVTWTDEGFTSISNIQNPASFANLKFTIKRNIINYYSQQLATANFYKKNIPISVTLYKNNPDAITVYNGISVKEGESFIPENPILSTWIDECEFLMSLEDYIKLENDVRNLRGFIRYIDSEGVVKRGFPKKMDFINRMDNKGVLNASLEVMHQPDIMKIFSDNQTGIIIINEIISTDYLSWNMDELGYLRIFDETGLLLFTKTLYEKVSVNGTIFNDKLSLEIALNNL